MSDQPSEEMETRVEQFVQQSDLQWVASILSQQRDAILASWLDAVVEQPFHAGRREHAVTDEIPKLYDALVAFLQGGAPRQVAPGAPLEDAGVLEAAQQHAQVRLEQGLEPPDVVVEFRLLRQEILAAMRRELPDSTPAGDVLAASLLVNDALDGAISVGLRALLKLVESVREDFLATTIHDVLQPVTVIKGNTQLVAQLLRNTNPDVQQLRELLGQVTTLADWMVVLLDALRDASRVALNQLGLSVGTVALASVLQEAIEGLGPEDAKRVILTIPWNLDTTGQWDRQRIVQVTKNLLSNALKYSQPDTPVHVSVLGTIESVEFSIQDRGIGLSEAELPRLFQRYSRAAGGVRQGVEGLGLGLYLCRGIIQAHGGRIWARSDGPGMGSTFHVMLPRVLPGPPT